MPMPSLFGKVYQALEKSLDIAKYQHGLISSNVANVDTPGYTTKEISFKKTLSKALGDDTDIDLVTTNPSHIALTQGEIPYVKSVRDSKPVDIDIEMSKLAQNNLRYKLAAETLARKFSGMKDLIQKAGGA